jgi:hypothetical protein
MGDGPSQFTSSDDADSRHESVGYSSYHNSQLHNSQLPIRSSNRGVWILGCRGFEFHEFTHR